MTMGLSGLYEPHSISLLHDVPGNSNAGMTSQRNGSPLKRQMDHFEGLQRTLDQCGTYSQPLRLTSKRRRSVADRFRNGLAYDLDDEAGRGDDRRVVDRMRPHPGVHTIRHKALRVRDDHAVLFRQQKPGRAVFPEWTIHR